MPVIAPCRCFCLWMQVISSHMCAAQYSAKDSRGSPCRSPENSPFSIFFSLSLAFSPAFSSLVIYLTNSSCVSQSEFSAPSLQLKKLPGFVGFFWLCCNQESLQAVNWRDYGFTLFVFILLEVIFYAECYPIFENCCLYILSVFHLLKVKGKVMSTSEYHSFDF